MIFVNRRLMAGLSGILTSAAALASEPLPTVGPVPAWVVPVQIPAADPKGKDEPVQFLVTASQSRLSADGEETYVEYSVLPNNIAGLQAVGTVALPWNVDRADMTLHRISIKRGEKLIDLLDKKELLVIRRENNLEKATLDGIRTVILPTKGVQVGDVMTVAMSYKTKPSTIAAHVDDITTMSPQVDVGRLERRFIVPEGVKVRWSKSAVVPVADERKVGNATEYRYVRGSSKPTEYPIGTPDRYTQQLVQVSGWEDWADVADRLKPLFDVARHVPGASPVQLEIAKIAAQSIDPKKRMLSALRLAQDNVRYVALLLGDGAYTPATAAETWDRRFGDCKGKTALLLGLLDGLGVKAEPLLVSNAYNDVLGDRLPSLAIFDHVIVKAVIGGTPYYLDATDYGQRTFDELRRSDFVHGLPLTADASLEKLATPFPELPLRESELVWDGRQGFDRSVSFEGTLTLRSEIASYLRAKKANGSVKDEFITELKNMMPGVRNEDLEIAEELPEQPDGSYVIKFKGSADMDWSPVDGKKGYRYALDQSIVRWTGDMEREEGRFRDLPVALNTPFFQRGREIILLPNGGKGFKLDASTLAEKMPGTEVRRTIELQRDRVVATSEFMHNQPEITAADARATKVQMQRINEDYAYVVAPGKIRAAPKQASK